MMDEYVVIRNTEEQGVTYLTDDLNTLGFVQYCWSPDYKQAGRYTKGEANFLIKECTHSGHIYKTKVV